MFAVARTQADASAINLEFASDVEAGLTKEGQKTLPASWLYDAVGSRLVRSHHGAAGIWADARRSRLLASCSSRDCSRPLDLPELVDRTGQRDRNQDTSHPASRRRSMRQHFVSAHRYLRQPLCRSATHLLRGWTACHLTRGSHLSGGRRIGAGGTCRGPACPASVSRQHHRQFRATRSDAVSARHPAQSCDQAIPCCWARTC